MQGFGTPDERRRHQGRSDKSELRRRRRIRVGTDMAPSEQAESQETRRNINGRLRRFGCLLHVSTCIMDCGTAQYAPRKHRHFRGNTRYERTHHAETGREVRRSEDQPQQYFRQHHGTPVQRRRTGHHAIIRQSWLQTVPPACGRRQTS